MTRSNVHSGLCTDMPFPAAGRPLRARLVGGALSLVLVAIGPSRPLLAEEEGISGDSQCQELETAADGAPDPEQIEHDGIAGMFFPMVTSRLILCEVRELRLRRREAGVESRLIHAWRLQVDFTERQRDLAVQARDQLAEVIDVAERRAREAEDRAVAWYRSPFLWLSVGVVLTVGLYFAASYGIRSLAPD